MGCYRYFDNQVSLICVLLIPRGRGFSGRSQSFSSCMPISKMTTRSVRPLILLDMVV